MDRIQHLAFGTPDVEKTANFYKEVFGLREIGRASEPKAGGNPGDQLLRRIFLTDGYTNLAICKDTHGEQTPTGRIYRVGFYHVGFALDNMEETRKRLDAAGARLINISPVATVAREYAGGPRACKYMGPQDIILDLSQGGWHV